MASIPEYDENDREHWGGGGYLPLAGRTEAENRMHGEAMVALLNRPVVDPEVVALFSSWTSQTRLGRAATEAQRCWQRLDQAAGVFGKRSWGELEREMGPDGSAVLTIETDTEEEAAAIEREVDTAQDEANRAAAEFEAALDHHNESGEGARLSDEAAEFVRKWAHSWPWMASELVIYWILNTVDATCRTRSRRTFWVATPPETPVPEFATRPGECLGEAVERLTRETLAGRTGLPKGKRTPTEIARRYVEWWYRHHIRRVSINRIARDAAAARGVEGDMRKLVYHGIAAAHGWLNAANRVWRVDAEDEQPWE